MDNSSKTRKTSDLHNRRTKDKNASRRFQRNKSKVLHASSSGRKAGKSTVTRKRQSIFGNPEDAARLSKLETALVNQANHPDTPFEYIHALGNPGTAEITGYPALTIWYEGHRTISSDKYNEKVRRIQEVLFGGLIQSSQSEEEEARQECYFLLEELEDRLIGFMPNLGSTTEMVQPIVDTDAAFSQIGQSGLYGLTVMFVLQWQVLQGTKEN